MRTCATAFLLCAAAGMLSAQSVEIRWAPTGGPIAGHQAEIFAKRDRLLLVGENGRWSRVLGRGMSWEVLDSSKPRPWKLAANDRDLFGDAVDGVVRSSDWGDSWARCGTLPVNRAIGREVTSIAADQHRVYVSVLNLGLFRSDDQCATWSRIATPGTVDSSVTIRYVNGPRLIVRAGGSFLSTDAGSTWTLLDGRLPDPLAFTTDCDGTMLAGTGIGVFASRDDGRSWTSIGLAGRWVPAVVAPRCDEVFAVALDEGRWTHSVFRSRNKRAVWTIVNDGLSGHPIVNLTADDQGVVYAVGASGAFRWSPERQWQLIGPADTYVPSVVATPWGASLAAGHSTGLHEAKAASGPWRAVHIDHASHARAREPGGEMTALLLFVTPQDHVLTSTANGVWQSRDRGETWRRVGLTHVVNSFVATKDGLILAGTDSGIFRSSDGGESWIERSIGLSSFTIHALATASDGTVYAGTWDGEVHQSMDDGDRWRPMIAPRQGRIRALLVLANGHLLVGGHDGLRRWDSDSRSWRVAPLKTQRGAGPMVRALIQDPDGAIFVGTEGDGAFASFDEGATWQPANEGLVATGIFSLAVDAQGHVVGGTSSGVFRATINRPRR